GISASAGAGVRTVRDGPGRSGTVARLRVLLTVLTVSTVSTVSVQAQGWLVIVTGIPGAPQYRASFDSVANAMATAARTRLGLSEAHIIRLDERTTPPATAEGIQSALATLATR